MAVFFLLLFAVVFAYSTFFLGTLLESLMAYYPLFKLCIVFNIAFIIQAVVAVISIIKTKKFGKGNIIRLIIFGIIAFVLFVIFIVMILLHNFQSWTELFSSLKK